MEVKLTWCWPTQECLVFSWHIQQFVGSGVPACKGLVYPLLRVWCTRFLGLVYPRFGSGVFVISDRFAQTNGIRHKIKTVVLTVA